MDYHSQSTESSTSDYDMEEDYNDWGQDYDDNEYDDYHSRQEMTTLPNVESGPSSSMQPTTQFDPTRLVQWNTHPKNIVHEILRQIGLEGAIPAFDKHGLSNYWLPIPQQTLRQLFNGQGDLRSFLEWQDRILKGNLAVFKRLKVGLLHAPVFHISFEDDEDLVSAERVLGEGAFGIVEEVLPFGGLDSTYCVRKKIGRPRQLKAQKQIIAAFAREINVMKQVNHPHCVRLIGSYTDFDSVNILLHPIADTDLANFLDQPLGDKEKTILYGGIHCICNALHYLHQKKIRHEDLKPQNILVMGETMLLTDFGFSLDFSDDSVSTTTGRPSAWTIRYSAPEVLDFEPRNRASDIFSLGCVLYEMISAIDGHRLSKVKEHWKHSGNGQSSFARNPEASSAYLEPLPSSFIFEAMPYLRDYTQLMLNPNRDLRPSAQQVVNRLSDLSLFFVDGPLHELKCCEAPQNPCRERIEVLDWVEPNYLFYSPGRKDWIYILLDFEFKRIASSPPDYEVYIEYDQALRTLGRDLYKDTEERETKSKSEFWNAHTIWKERQGDLSAAEICVETSARILSIKDIWFSALSKFIFSPLEPDQSKWSLPWPEVTVQVSLVPVCLPRSPYYGAFFYMLSFPFSAQGSLNVRFDRKLTSTG